MNIHTVLSRRFARILIPMGIVLMSATAASAAPGVSAWGKLERAKWVTQGSKTPQHLVYVVMDANCPFCHDLWALLRTHYVTGLQVRYVMVGFISANSPGKAAAILEAADPSQALDLNETNFGHLPHDLGGGIPPEAEMTQETAMSLMVNEALIRELGVLGTPALFYKDKRGTLHLIQSVPSAKALDGIVANATKD